MHPRIVSYRTYRLRTYQFRCCLSQHHGPVVLYLQTEEEVGWVNNNGLCYRKMAVALHPHGRPVVPHSTLVVEARLNTFIKSLKEVLFSIDGNARQTFSIIGRGLCVICVLRHVYIYSIEPM
jgi:hypothetical protein